MRIRRVSFLMAAILTAASCTTARFAANIDFHKIDDAYGYEGILEERFHDCSVPGPSKRRMYVYLPADYYESDFRYPVLYLLHGARGNETSWIIKGHILQHADSLMKDGKMEKTIIVFPNTNQHKSDKDYGKSREKGAVEALFEVAGDVESAFMSDVVQTIDSIYRTIPEKSGRAIGGLSIGALQSIHISANHPDCFDYVGLFSPMIRPALNHGVYSAFYRKLKMKQRRQFADPPQLYWIMIGKKDFFYPRAKQYCRYLYRNGYQFEFLSSAGGHDWPNWVSYCNLFMKRLWKQSQN